MSRRSRRPTGIIRRLGEGSRRSLSLLLALLLLASLAHGSAARIDPPGTLSVVATSAPSGDPCGSQRGAFHDHVLCCSSASCSVFVPVNVAFAFAPDVRTTWIGGADLDFSSHAPPALFHPPKLLVIA